MEQRTSIEQFFSHLSFVFPFLGLQFLSLKSMARAVLMEEEERKLVVAEVALFLGLKTSGFSH
ncbi:hypothetical protein AMTRI_Chr06g172630 [Amborella trichopoda]